MRKDVQDALCSLSFEELREAHQLVESLLGRLQDSALPRPLPQDGREQRRGERYSINLPVTFFRHGAAAALGEAEGSGVHEAVVRDISTTGLRFFTDRRLEPDEVLTVCVPGPLGVRKLFVDVRRTERRGTQFECGAEFVGLDRVFAAQRAEEERSETGQILVACGPSPERDSLVQQLVKQGFTLHVANSVPDALEMLDSLRSAMVLAAAPLLRAEGGRLGEALRDRRDDVLSIAIVSISDLDGPHSDAVRACHDFLVEPSRAQEVRMVVGRTYRRLLAAQARRAGPQAT